MQLITLPVGQLTTNCYLVWDPDSLEALVIDPGDDGDFIIQNLLRLRPASPAGGLRLNSVIATHAHFDHVLAALEVKLAFGAPFLMSHKDLPLLRHADSSGQYWLKVKNDPAPIPDGFLKDGDVLRFGKEALRVIETPGHTPGSISLYAPGVLFSGDTLFASDVGRTDFSYGSSRELKNSIRSKLFTLPPATRVYPGHGEPTDIQTERRRFKL